LGMAGIPFVTKQEDLANLLASLKGLNSVSNNPKIERLMVTIAGEKERSLAVNDQIEIDLASHYKSSLSKKIEILQNAIKNSKCVKFICYSKKGESLRMEKPIGKSFE
jgi:predicted DNA-binding transcriptional regulator YafY